MLNLRSHQTEVVEKLRDGFAAGHRCQLLYAPTGFGKTEVAIRAAFKAVNDRKQVAILVPTTILAMQHFQTLKERLENFPVKVDYLNRFRSAKDIKAIKEQVASGEIDILIGTHKIVG